MYKLETGGKQRQNQKKDLCNQRKIGYYTVDVRCCMQPQFTLKGWGTHCKRMSVNLYEV